jgi:hypothetical protein
VDADDAGVLDLGRGPRFAKKLLNVVVRELFFPGDFDGDSSIQFRIASFPDRTEGADAQSLGEFEMAERAGLLRFEGNRIVRDKTKPAAATVA